MCERLELQSAPCPGARLARIAEDRGIRYVVVFDPAGELDEALADCSPEILRAFRRSEGPRPVVGDWVWVVAPRIASNPHRIEGIVPRLGAFTRQRPHSPEAQVLAANADMALLLAAAGPDFNLRRIERYLAASHEANASPILILGKVDLAEDRAHYLEALRELIDAAQIVQWSALTLEGLDELRERLAAGGTAALLGSSGVGKSTLINRLLGEERLDTNEVRRDGKGRHTTTRRQLLALPSGGVVIDTPGIRELALYEADEGVAETFEDVERVAADCRFNDCQHDAEPGCAVRLALDDGRLDPARVRNYLKLREELASSAQTRARRRRPTAGGRSPKKRRRGGANAPEE